MVKIAKNKYVNAALVLMLFSAIAHMVILFFSAVATKDMHALNYFNILDFDFMFPDLFTGFWVDVFSWIFVGFLYAVILKANKDE